MIAEVNDQTELKDFLCYHLRVLQCNKLIVRKHLSTLKNAAHLDDLQHAIVEACEDIDKQIKRIDLILSELKSNPSTPGCESATAMLEEAAFAIERYKETPDVRDMAILYYMQNMESIETSSFKILKLIAEKLQVPQTFQMLKECFDEAKGDRKLISMISERFLDK